MCKVELLKDSYNHWRAFRMCLARSVPRSLATYGASAALLLVRWVAVLPRAGLPLVPGWLGRVGWGVRLGLLASSSGCSGSNGVNAFLSRAPNLHVSVGSVY